MAGYFDVQTIILFNNDGCVVVAKLLLKECTVNNFCRNAALSIQKSWLSLLKVYTQKLYVRQTLLTSCFVGGHVFLRTTWLKIVFLKTVDLF